MTMTFQHDDLPLALYSAAQVRDLDARLIAAGTPGFELMQRAAHAAWRASVSYTHLRAHETL
ncbi:hypothetical protein, partial [Pseudomonas aeruginosa]|uniref:hypothetical protein n=1 Tax=Pseudomonas aeruginosa TaxID=287 RepID=UPI001CA5E573